MLLCTTAKIVALTYIVSGDMNKSDSSVLFEQLEIPGPLQISRQPQLDSVLLVPAQLSAAAAGNPAIVKLERLGVYNLLLSVIRRPGAELTFIIVNAVQPRNVSLFSFVVNSFLSSTSSCSNIDCEPEQLCSFYWGWLSIRLFL